MDASALVARAVRCEDAYLRSGLSRVCDTVHRRDLCPTMPRISCLEGHRCNDTTLSRIRSSDKDLFRHCLAANCPERKARRRGSGASAPSHLKRGGYGERSSRMCEKGGFLVGTVLLLRLYIRCNKMTENSCNGDGPARKIRLALLRLEGLRSGQSHANYCTTFRESNLSNYYP